MNNNLIIFTLELLLTLAYLIFGIVRIVSGLRTKNMKLMIFDFSRRQGTLVGTKKEKFKFYLNLVANVAIISNLIYLLVLLLMILQISI